MSSHGGTGYRPDHLLDVLQLINLRDSETSLNQTKVDVSPTETNVDKSGANGQEETKTATNQSTSEPNISIVPETRDVDTSSDYDLNQSKPNIYEQYLLLVMKKLFYDYFDGQNEPHPIFSNFLH